MGVVAIFKAELVVSLKLIL